MTEASYLLGSSYYPEQWKASRWDDDFRKMAGLGFNTVRMGEFAWAFFEPSPGRFAFGWMDDAIAQASRYGIRTVLCTPTASVPPWLREAHPEVLGANERGPFDYGARKGHSITSAALLDAAERVVSALASQYCGSPDIAAWQIDNEPGYPFRLYDAVTLKAFHQWLEKRYGTLEALNDTWGTAFWSHVYTRWEQIEFPVNRADGGWNPSQHLDYRRFFSDSFLHYLRRQAEIVRAQAGGCPIFTNWPNTYWSVDVFQASDFLDCQAWDNYAPDPGVTPWRDQLTASGVHHDLCRSASRDRRGFLVAEQKAQVAAHADPAGVRLQTYGDLAHGAWGTIFFEWRPPAAGGEMGYPSVLNPDGGYGLAEPEYRRLSAELRRIGPRLRGATTRTVAALIYCYENAWDKGFWSGPDGYDAEYARYHEGLRTGMGVDIDVLAPPTTDSMLSGYRVVAAPGLRLLSDAVAERLLRWVLDGGILLLNQEAGSRDERNQVRESLAPGPLAAAAGVQVVASSSGSAVAGNLITGTSDQGVKTGGFGIRFTGEPEVATYALASRIELLRPLPDAHPLETLAVFTGGRLDGEPAVTLHTFGKGAVVYVATDSRDLQFYEQIVRILARRFGIDPIVRDVPPGIEVSRRETETEEFLFLLNHAPESRTVALGAGDAWEELISETATVTGEWVIAPLDVAVLVRPR